jgi:cytochrome b561
LPPAKGREEITGLIHHLLAFGLAGLATLHILAALKHHFLNGDTILRRML